MNGKVQLLNPVAKRPRRRLVGADRAAVVVDALDDDLVLADVQPLTVPAADGLHTDFG